MISPRTRTLRADSQEIVAASQIASPLHSRKMPPSGGFTFSDSPRASLRAPALRPLLSCKYLKPRKQPRVLFALLSCGLIRTRDVNLLSQLRVLTESRKTLYEVWLNTQNFDQLLL